MVSVSADTGKGGEVAPPARGTPSRCALGPGAATARMERCRMTASARGLIPATPPFRLPWQLSRPDCRPVIGDALLLQYELQKCSMRYMPELTVRQARDMLAAWAAEQDRGRGTARRGGPDSGRRRAQQERGSPADPHRADHNRPHRRGRTRASSGRGCRMTGCVAIAWPDAREIPGETGSVPFVSRHAHLRIFGNWGSSRACPARPRSGTANAVGVYAPPGFKSRSLRSSPTPPRRFREGGSDTLHGPGLQFGLQLPSSRTPQRLVHGGW